MRMVVDAVIAEPVSTPRFPANREKNREFCKIALTGPPQTAKNGVVTGLARRIPYSTEQGIILAEQGILAQEQGILFGFWMMSAVTPTKDKRGCGWNGR
jgi:hypothetical protein